MENKKSELSIWSVMQDYWRENGVDESEGVQDLSAKLYYGEKWALMKRTLKNAQYYAMEISEKENEVKSKEDETKVKHLQPKKRDYINWARILHLLYKIPYEKFGFDANDVDTDLFPKIPKPNASYIQRLLIKSDEEEDTVAFKRNYKEALSLPLKEMKKSIVVYDYLERQNYNDPEYLEPYFDAHTSIYSRFEEKLKDSSFQYTRFLALPLRYKPSDKLIELCKEQKYLIHLAAILNNCSLPLFRHICKCVHLLGDKFEERKTGFFLVAKPTRTYQWAIIDDGEYLISEYYRYSENNVCKPDVMFVDVKNEENEKLRKIYDREKRGLLKVRAGSDTHNPAIGVQFFEDAVNVIMEWSDFRLQEALNDLGNNIASNDYLHAKDHNKNTKLKFTYFKEIKKLLHRVENNN